MASLMEQYEQVTSSKSPSPGTFSPSASLGTGGQQPVGVSGFVKLQAQDEQVRVCESEDLAWLAPVLSY